MEKLLLGIILVAAVAGLARMVWRSARRAGDPGCPPACAGCPLSSKCQTAAPATDSTKESRDDGEV